MWKTRLVMHKYLKGNVWFISKKKWNYGKTRDLGKMRIGSQRYLKGNVWSGSKEKFEY